MHDADTSGDGIHADNDVPTPTSQLEAEFAQSRLSEAHRRAVLESAHDFAIITSDLAGTITSWNAGAEKLLGWTEEEAIGQSACIIFTAADEADDACAREMEGATLHGRAEDERWHRRKDASLFWASGLMMRLEDDLTGEHIGFLKVLRDRTAQHRAEEDRKESDALASALFQSSSDCMKLLKMDGRVQAMNEPGMSLMEIDDLGAVVGMHWADLWPVDVRQTVRSAIEEARAGRSARFDGFCPTAKGTPKWWDVQVSPVLGASDRPRMILTVSRDMTERARSEKAVFESELRFRNLADHAPVMMWVTGPDGYCSYLNQRWYEFTGQTEEEALGLGWTKATHPDDQKLAEDTFLAAVVAKGPFQVEYRLRRADGTYRWAIDAAAPRFSETGEFLGHVGSVIDIDERREQEDALRDAHILLAAVMEAVPGVVYAKNREGRVLAANRGTADLVGKPLSEILGRTDAEFLDDTTQAEAVMVNDRRVMNGDHTEVLEEQVDFPDGTRATWLSTKSPLRDAAGKVVGLVGSSLDITELKRTQEELRRLNEGLEAQVAERTADRDRMWRLSTDLMLVARFDGTITAVNPAWTTLLGWAEHELIGRSFVDLVHPDDAQDTRTEAGKLASGHTTLRFENRYRHRDGSHLWLSWTAVPGEDLIHAVARDITAEMEQAAALQQTEEALRQAQKMEAVGQLTGGIAHDFNNLLTGVIGSLDMMQRRIANGETDKIERYATTAITAANRAAALTHRLLAFSRRQPLDAKPVNSNRLVTGMEELLRRTLGETVQLEIVTAGGLWQTLCDPHQLESAILNLAINARDAMPDGGRLTIETCNAHLDTVYAAQSRDVRPGQYVCICVTDTGTGMSPDVIAKAFDPFFTTKPIGQGTGLGLSMIYGFARQSEGYAKIYSEVGQGTTIKLYLPRYYGEGDEVEESSTGLTEEHRSGHGEVVLVVEDETAVRDLVVEVLEELGYRAIQAHDGPAGLKILESDARIDLLVTDVGLPGLNGRQLADRARERRSALKVLFMTGYAENATIANGFLEPGMQMITKPFAVEALATRIRNIIESS